MPLVSLVDACSISPQSNQIKCATIFDSHEIEYRGRPNTFNREQRDDCAREEGREERRCERGRGSEQQRERERERYLGVLFGYSGECSDRSSRRSLRYRWPAGLVGPKPDAPSAESGDTMRAGAAQRFK